MTTAAATNPRATDPVVRAVVGRDWMVCDGYHCVVQLLPMRSLMTKPQDQGCMTLVGAEIEVGVRRSRQRHLDRGDAIWRPYIRVRSDAGEIAERRAAA